MGYTKQGQITNFWPDNTEKELWLESDHSFTIPELTEKIKEHFSTDDLTLFEITAEYIHTNAIHYDLHDSSDYTKFIKITKKQ